MRLPKYNNISHARGVVVLRGFRSHLQPRVMWAVSGLLVLGLVAGVVFYNPSDRTPLQNQPTAPHAITTAVPPSPKIDAAEPMTHEVPNTNSAAASGQHTPTPPAATNVVPPQVPQPISNCQNEAKQKAATQRDSAMKTEEERYQKLMNRRSAIKRLLSSITGTVISPPSQNEVQKHESIIQQIHLDYNQAMTAAHC